MQQSVRKRKTWRFFWIAAAAIVLWKARALVWLAARYLFLGWVTALAALPLMKHLERRMKKGPAAALSMAALNAVWAVALFLLLPALIRQVRQLTGMMPGLWQGLETLSSRIQTWMTMHGMPGLDTEMQSALLTRAQDALGAAVPAVISRLRGVAGGLGQWLLAPVFGFYFLRDRRMISAWLQSFLPVGWRQTVVELLSEMRRETVGYLRGQLMVSGIVAVLTAIGLLICRVPSWFALGIWMGVLELLPYIGPLVGGVTVALFTLPMGLWRTVWALGAVLVVQQLEGCVIAPKLISQTTRLHPVAVILCILLGGSAAGVAGVLLVVPLVLCLRAVWRVLVMEPLQQE